MIRTLFIKLRKRRKDEFQFFMHDFIDECVKNGLTPLKDILPSYQWHIRAIIRNLLLVFYKLIHQHFPQLISRNKGNLIITGNGSTIEDSLFPYFCGYNVIPMLWDCWPDKWEIMIKDFKLFDINTVFVTSSQVVKRINAETNVHAVWIPEGINASLYNKGKELKDRTIDVMDMGRRMLEYEEVITKLQKEGVIQHVITSKIDNDGNLDDKHVVYTNEELHQMMSDSKIMICFPRCDTNPQTAGNIETLTQRYWEAMLSRCIIIGRAPKELIQFLGYSPVIEVDWKRPEKQLIQILSNISHYQELVNRNYKSAKEKADWSNRIGLITQSI